MKGHAGHAENERADELAREGIAAIRAGAHRRADVGRDLPAPKRLPRKSRSARARPRGNAFFDRLAMPLFSCRRAYVIV